MIHQDKILKLTIFLVSLYLIGPFYNCLFLSFLLQGETRPSHFYGTSERSSQFNHSGKQI